MVFNSEQLQERFLIRCSGLQYQRQNYKTENDKTTKYRTVKRQNIQQLERSKCRIFQFFQKQNFFHFFRKICKTFLKIPKTAFLVRIQHGATAIQKVDSHKNVTLFWVRVYFNFTLFIQQFSLNVVTVIARAPVLALEPEIFFYFL